jgi:hypothetical protein
MFQLAARATRYASSPTLTTPLLLLVFGLAAFLLCMLLGITPPDSL